ncbi:MAG: RloB family protein [Streptosporangiaceae bacterium]
MTSASRKRSRQVSSQARRIQLRVFAEGKKTEDIYLTNWSRLYRDRVIVSMATHKHTTPFELTEAAVRERGNDIREARRGRGAAFHQYWCIFDVDEHPKIPEALSLAAANNISVALSSPCIELWFLIHFEDQTAYIDRREAQRRSKEILGCDKALNPAALDLLVENFDAAKVRAKILEIKHIGDVSPQPWNPCSTVWKIVDEIMRTPPVTS